MYYINVSVSTCTNINVPILTENQPKHRGGGYPDVRVQHVQAQDLGTRDSEIDYEPNDEFNSKG